MAFRWIGGGRGMAQKDSTDFDGLPFPKARARWLAVSDRLDDGRALDLACSLVPRFPAQGFFIAQALNLGRATGQQLRVARLVAEVAAVSPQVPVHHVMTAADILMNAAAPEEQEEAVALRDRLIEASPRRHYFRAALAQRARDRDTAAAEIAAHLQRFPDDAQALVLRGTLAWQGGRWGRHCRDILAMRQAEGNPRAAEMLDLFARFRAAQGLAQATPEEIAGQEHRLETPGAVYEYAMTIAPPPDAGERRGVVMLTGSLAGGGAERIVATTLNRFRAWRDDEEAQLWLFSKASGDAGDALFYLPLTGLREDELHIVGAANVQSEPFCWLPPFYAQRAQALYDDLLRTRPRVIYLTLDEAIIAGGIAAVMAGVPEIILHCHNMSPPNLHGHDRHCFGWDRAFRALLARPNVRYVNVAQAAVDDYLDWCGADPAACRATVIHNGIDFSAIDEGLAGDLPRSIRRELGIPLRSPVVGAALRFTEVKQPLLWLEAARQIRDAVPKAHFVLYGDGALLEPARAHAERLGFGDCVHFPGRVSDLARRLPVFDVLMLSSRSEGFPNVLIEAQAAGVVPVAFDVGGCAETMAPGRTGIAVAEKTADALAGEVIALLRNRRRLRRMKRAGMAFVRATFAFERMVAALHGLVYGAAPPARATDSAAEDEVRAALAGAARHG